MTKRGILVIMCLGGIAAPTHPSDAEDLSVTTENGAILALEKDWLTDHHGSYFEKAMDMLQTRNAKPKATAEFFASQLDIAACALLRSLTGMEFGSDAGAVRNCQAEITKQLISVSVADMKGLPGWSELRTRYGRLLMLQRATWISLRDATLDGKPIELDSTVRLDADTAAHERVLRNQRIALQQDLKRFMNEIGPTIDKFMVAAFSEEPRDARMFASLLGMGLYTSEERAKLLAGTEELLNKGKEE